MLNVNGFQKQYLLKYSKYEDELYDLFKKEYMNSSVIYNNLPVVFRETPKHLGKEEAFYHIICKKDQKKNEFNPTSERCERILWSKYIILNEPCRYDCCDGIYVWEEKNPHNRHRQILLYLKEHSYLVILEPRKTYYNFVTGYYVDGSEKRRNLIKKYRDYKKQNAPATTANA